jgi:acyl dehydratase
MAEKIDFNQIEVGESFEPWHRGGLCIELFQEYGEASGDGNPMHTDEEYAQDLGYPTVFAQGMLIMAFASKYVTDLCGVGRIKRIKSRFARQSWPGETLTFRATVKKKYTEDEKNLLDLELTVKNQEGEQKLIGEATIIV